MTVKKRLKGCLVLDLPRKRLGLCDPFSDFVDGWRSSNEVLRLIDFTQFGVEVLHVPSREFSDGIDTALFEEV